MTSKGWCKVVINHPPSLTNLGVPVPPKYFPFYSHPFKNVYPFQIKKLGRPCLYCYIFKKYQLTNMYSVFILKRMGSTSKNTNPLCLYINLTFINVFDRHTELFVEWTHATQSNDTKKCLQSLFLRQRIANFSCTVLF